MSSRLPLLLALFAGALTVAGCSSALKIEPFPQADSAQCLQASALWPATVAQMPPQVVAVQTDSVAAWGDPAIIARCGGTPPGPTTDTCYDIEGVHWIEIPLDDGWAFTTYGRDPAIEVLIPDLYSPPIFLLPAFNPAAETIEATRFCSSTGDSGGSSDSGDETADDIGETGRATGSAP